jgi:hypothetical protein
MIKLLIDNTVDSIQVSKKMFVDTFVKHEGLAKTMHEFVDAQTEYTKKAIDVGFTTSTNMYKALSDKSFYADTMKAFKDATTSFNTPKKEK